MDKSILFTPGKIGPLTLRNRTIRAAAFESMCPGNAPSEQLFNYHIRSRRRDRHDEHSLCRRDAKRLVVRASAVDASDIIPGLRKLTDAIHKEEPPLPSS